MLKGKKFSGSFLEVRWGEEVQTGDRSSHHWDATIFLVLASNGSWDSLRPKNSTSCIGFKTKGTLIGCQDLCVQYIMIRAALLFLKRGELAYFMRLSCVSLISNFSFYLHRTYSMSDVDWPNLIKSYPRRSDRRYNRAHYAICEWSRRRNLT